MAGQATTATVGHSAAVPQHMLLGETYGFWAQTFVLFLGAAIAYLAIRSSRGIERRKAAMGAIFAGRRDKDLVAALRRIAKLHEDDVNLAPFGRNDAVDKDEAKMIRYALNHYEYVSVGIGRGIFDESVLKSASYSTITKLYKHTKPFIEEVRKAKQTNTTWQEFECLACRWEANPLRHKPVMAVQWGKFRRLFFG